MISGVLQTFTSQVQAAINDHSQAVLDTLLPSLLDMFQPGYTSSYTRIAVQAVSPVEAEMSPIPPQFHHETSPDTITGKAGQTLMIDCQVSGEPVPQITWSFHNPSHAASDIETTVRVMHYEGRTVLIVRPLARDNGTILTCTASNEAGEVSWSTELKVEEEHTNEERTEEDMYEREEGDTLSSAPWIGHYTIISREDGNDEHDNLMCQCELYDYKLYCKFHNRETSWSFRLEN